MGWFTDWRRARVLKNAVLDESVWRATVARYAFARALTDAEQARLRELSILFLHEKAIQGEGGLVLREEIHVSIALQACILILNLGLDYYRGWTEVLVYPDVFLTQHEFMDRNGVVHQMREPATGESWLQGPVILSWADIEWADHGTGYNVAIHEFAHKLDMINGAANGFPPLHGDMNREAWARAFGAAYENFCRRVEGHEETLIDPYAAEDPGEFFAVVSEAFFEIPDAVRVSYPEVYRQLVLFYRQDPGLRLENASAVRPSVSRRTAKTAGQD